ncbi:MAG TPA: hypothetical protein VFV66_30680 [Nonomuraea sp.]|nr:hypothetical protein [Nonomuraea sp.]
MTQLDPHPAAAPPATPPTPPILDRAARHLLKATHVPVETAVPATGQAIVKFGFAGRLGLRPGEVAAIGDPGAPVNGEKYDLDALAAFERGGTGPEIPPRPSTFAAIPSAALLRFGRAVIERRRRELALAAESGADAAELGRVEALLNQAVIAVGSLEFNTGSSPLGMLNLERLELAPAGIERGELIATIPLAPLEETAVTQKEWSVTTKEFTSIVTDELEDVSETGVTDNTELAQTISSQIQHSNQFNVTGTVSGGIPLISGSVTSGFTSQGSESASAADSRKHATSLTQKASSRARHEHKVTISTTTVTGTSQSTTRTLRNPSATDPVRVDYFAMMRKWRVRLYRYGLRLTYDVVVPEPGAAMRRAYARLEELGARLGPFEFPVSHSEITADVLPGDPPPSRPHYLVLADRYGAQVPPPPAPGQPVVVNAQVTGLGGASGAISSFGLPFRVPDGQWVREIRLDAQITSPSGVTIHSDLLGCANGNHDGGNVEITDRLLMGPQGRAFMEHATGGQNAMFVFQGADFATVQLRIATEPTAAAVEQWRTDVWNALYAAAQNRHAVEQEELAARIAALEDRLTAVDTLTLRREESDEIMKGVLRFMLGADFDFMPPSVVEAFGAAGVDLAHGIGFDGNDLGLDPAQWSVVRRHEDMIRFVNQAIEWENVVTFLYSYFWDVPPSWEFVRGLKHPDPTRQAFLRAGSARVVLTVRKGWEEAWVRFAEGGFMGADVPADHPYLTVAQEIAAYDERNYPGIPPANPARTAARFDEAVATVSNAVAAPGRPVNIKVASSAGFAVGGQVIVDVADERGLQEAATVVAVPDPTHVVVDELTRRHDGTVTPFPVVQPGEKGVLIAEWNEYTPTSGTDIALTSNLASIA